MKMYVLKMGNIIHMAMENHHQKARRISFIFFSCLHYGKAYCKSDPSNQHGKFLCVQPCQRRITPSTWDVLVAKQDMTPEIIFPSIARKNSWQKSFYGHWLFYYFESIYPSDESSHIGLGSNPQANHWLAFLLWKKTMKTASGRSVSVPRKRALFSLSILHFPVPFLVLGLGDGNSVSVLRG